MTGWKLIRPGFEDLRFSAGYLQLKRDGNASSFLYAYKNPPASDPSPELPPRRNRQVEETSDKGRGLIGIYNLDIPGCCVVEDNGE